MFQDPSTETAAIGAIVRQGMTPEITKVPGIDLQILSRSPDTKLASLEHFNANPIRARGTQVLATLQGMLAFLTKQVGENDNPAIFADRSGLLVTAVLNHHEKDKPAWMDRRVTVKHNLSRQLLIWKAKNGVKMTQEEFSLFLEENIGDIAEPTGAEVLTFADTLEATRTEVFKSSIKTTTGETKLAYSSERTGDGSTALIEQIKLGIPLFERGDPFAVEVKIFHRVQDGKLTFWFNILRLEALIDKAWEDILAFLHDNMDDIAGIYEGIAPAETAPLALSI